MAVRSRFADRMEGSFGIAVNFEGDCWLIDDLASVFVEEVVFLFLRRAWTKNLLPWNCFGEWCVCGYEDNR